MKKRYKDILIYNIRKMPPKKVFETAEEAAE
jgi:hypothetical protein